MLFRSVVFLSTNYNGIKIGGGSIGGYLTKNGKPISGRFMKLYIGGNDYINNEVASTRTDANGHYNFTSLKPAIYHVGKEDVKGDSSYSVGYDAKGNPIVEYTDITFNVLKQTSGITLADKQVINDLNFGVDWPSNYQEVPGKYTDNLSKYTGVPLK